MSGLDAELNTEEALQQIWTAGGSPTPALAQVDLIEEPQLFASSFATGRAATASIAAAALAAETLYHHRTGAHQTIRVTQHDAERECTAHFTYNGKRVTAWEKFSGLYPTKDGHARVHANFDHHRDGVLQLLGFNSADTTSKEAVAEALLGWSAEKFESAAAAAGLVVSMVRKFDEWDQHPHALATAKLPLLSINKIGEAPARSLAAIDTNHRPLEQVRVLDLTRILAGPTCGRALAAYGADVMLINSPKLPNIANIMDTSRGKRSAHVDLTTASGRDNLQRLLAGTNIFVQGYRPQALTPFGLSPVQLAQQHPGLVLVSLSAYSNTGPWAERRGFDSLVQTATGFNHAEMLAAQADTPISMPLPILDYVSGFLMAYGAQAALQRQLTEGGTWHVEVSLLQTAQWLRQLGRIEYEPNPDAKQINNYLQPYPCDHGELACLPHAAQFSTTPAIAKRASVMPGTDSPSWD